MKSLLIFCVSGTLLTGCFQERPPAPKPDHEIAAGCLGWNIERQVARPSSLASGLSIGAIRLEDARSVNVRNGECRDVSDSGRVVMDIQRSRGIWTYDLSDGRAGMLIAVSQPSGGITYVGGIL